MKRSGIVALALLAGALAFFAAVEVFAEEDRTFHSADLAAISALPPGAPTVPTHLKITGWVTYKKVEADGDVHLRLSDGDSFVVLECIPELPEIAVLCRNARVWTKATVWGISRFDGWPGHGWLEIHPVLGIEATP